MTLPAARTQLQAAQLPAAQSALDPQASSQLAQAMMANATIAVDPTGQKMGANIPMMPGRTGGGLASLVGAASSNQQQQIQTAQKQIQQNSKGASGVLMGEELTDALVASGESQQRYNRTQYNRFRPGSQAGAIESLYDAIAAPFTRKKMQDDKRDVLRLNEEYQQRQLQAEVDKENDRRREYVTSVLPMLKAKFPNMSEDALTASATQMAAQNLPMDKVFPEGASVPVQQNYLDQQTGATMGRWIDPQTKQPIHGKEPWMIKGPTAKTTASGSKWIDVTDANGNVVATEYGAPGANGERPILSEIQKGFGEEPGRRFAEMPGDQRKNLSLITSASNDVAISIPMMFTEDGDWRNLATAKPNSAEKAALDGYGSGVKKILRFESGAQLSDSEIATMADQYIPNATDGDVTARNKVVRFKSYLTTLHSGYASGYKDLPPELGFSDINLHWQGTEMGQQDAHIQQRQSDLEEANRIVAEYEEGRNGR